MIYSLEKLYTYIGIDPEIKSCGCNNNGYCGLKSSPMYEDRCLPGYPEVCKDRIPIEYYPKLTTLYDSQYLALLDVICEAGVLSLSINTVQGAKIYRFDVDTLRTESAEKEVALLQMVEAMFEADKFNQEQKDKIFYIISYLEIEDDN